MTDAECTQRAAQMLRWLHGSKTFVGDFLFTAKSLDERLFLLRAARAGNLDHARTLLAAKRGIERMRRRLGC